MSEKGWLCEGLWCSDDQSLGGGLIDLNLGSHSWSRQEKVMEVFVPLVIKPALVNPYVPFQWTLEDHWSHCSASALFASQLSSQTSHVHKQASQTMLKKKKKKQKPQYAPQMIIIRCQWNIFLDLHSAIIFNLWNHSLIGSWGFIGCLLLSMPRRRALSKKNKKNKNIKTPTWIHQHMIGMPNVVLFVSWRYSTKTAGFCHFAFFVC